MLRSVLLATVIFLLVISCQNQETQSNETNSSTSVEETVLEFSIPAKLEYVDNSNSEFLVDEFYPIGWSKDGKFAYLVEPADEATGFYFFEIVVKDMNTNNIIWSWKPAEENEDGSLRKVWETNYTLFKDKLNYYKIKQSERIALEKTEFAIDSKNYIAELDLKMEENPDFGFDVVRQATITVSSPQLGRKTVAKYDNDQYSMVLVASLAGILVSTFENKMAVVYKEVHKGFEGPPNVVRFKAEGCHLQEGYMKEAEN